MAFQVMDDILDLREGTQVLGKPAGNDLRQGVITLPVMIFLEQATDTQRELVAAIVQGDETDDAVIVDTGNVRVTLRIEHRQHLGKHPNNHRHVTHHDTSHHAHHTHAPHNSPIH